MCDHFTVSGGFLLTQVTSRHISIVCLDTAGIKAIFVHNSV